MGSLNRIEIIGNLGRDPELRSAGDGTPVCNFTVATTEAWKGKDGDRQEKTEWHRVSAWGKLGEIAAKNLKKGRQVYIDGSLRSREYTDKAGEKKVSYEIRANNIVFLSDGKGPRAEGSSSHESVDSGYDD